MLPLIALITLLALLLPSALRAQTTTLKIATIVPEGSIWDATLRRMSDQWRDATSGRVAVTVFSGGSQGDEPTLVRKMRLNTLQGAALSIVGLAAIEPSFNVFGVPFFFQSDAELAAVVDALTPVLRQRIEAKGFALVNWGHGGWLQLFSKTPVASVADLKSVKLYTSAGDDRMTQWYKGQGFQPRAMAMTDILTGLSTGMLDAVPTTPLAAVAFQWHKHTSHMLDLRVGPVVGATVIARRAWDRISADDRAVLARVASAAEDRLRQDVPKQEALAVLLMQSQGLTMTKATGPEWQQLADGLAASMRGSMVPADVFDLALQARAAFRQRNQAVQAR
ncbi:MAG: TRAP transporter substrate-binding protein DctP [Vicinamibacterales bacterium]